MYFTLSRSDDILQMASAVAPISGLLRETPIITMLSGLKKDIEVHARILECKINLFLCYSKDKITAAEIK